MGSYLGEGVVKLLQIRMELCELFVLLGKEPTIVRGGDFYLVVKVAVQRTLLLG